MGTRARKAPCETQEKSETKKEDDDERHEWMGARWCRGRVDARSNRCVGLDAACLSAKTGDIVLFSTPDDASGVIRKLFFGHSETHVGLVLHPSTATALRLTRRYAESRRASDDGEEAWVLQTQLTSGCAQTVSLKPLRDAVCEYWRLGGSVRLVRVQPALELIRTPAQLRRHLARFLRRLLPRSRQFRHKTPWFVAAGVLNASDALGNALRVARPRGVKYARDGVSCSELVAEWMHEIGAIPAKASPLFCFPHHFGGTTMGRFSLVDRALLI